MGWPCAGESTNKPGQCGPLNLCVSSAFSLCSWWASRYSKCAWSPQWSKQARPKPSPHAAPRYAVSWDVWCTSFLSRESCKRGVFSTLFSVDPVRGSYSGFQPNPSSWFSLILDSYRILYPGSPMLSDTQAVLKPVSWTAWRKVGALAIQFIPFLPQGEARTGELVPTWRFFGSISIMERGFPEFP